MSIFRIIWALATRDLKTRYKSRFMSIFSPTIQPFFSLLVFTVVFTKIIQTHSEGVPYPVFNYCALVFWSFTASTLVISCTCLANNQPLISRLRIPMMTIPASVLLTQAVPLIASLLILTGFLGVFHHLPGINVLYLIPVFFIQCLLTLGLAFLLACITPYVREIQNILPTILFGWMFLTPVVYSAEILKQKMGWIFWINPMCGIIASARGIVLHNQAPLAVDLVPSILWSIVIFIFGFSQFKKLSGNIADVL